MACWVSSFLNVMIHCPKSVGLECQNGRLMNCWSWHVRPQMRSECKNTNPAPTHMIVSCGFFFAFPTRPCTPWEQVPWLVLFTTVSPVVHTATGHSTCTIKKYCRLKNKWRIKWWWHGGVFLLASFLSLSPFLPFFLSYDTNTFLHQYLNDGVTYIDRETKQSISMCPL